MLEIRGKSEVASKDESIKQFMSHNIKRNYATLSIYCPVGYFYLFLSMWQHLKS